MAKQSINVGQVANDRTGDPLRVAFSKVNANFTELYQAIENIDPGEGAPSTPEQPKEWLNPESNKTWSIVDRVDGVRVMTTMPRVDETTVVALAVPSRFSVEIANDEAAEIIDDYWNGRIEGGYNFTEIIVNGVTYNGFVSTYLSGSNRWRVNIDTEEAGIEVGTQFTIRYVGYQTPVKWFDAADYPNAENFLGAKIEYYAHVEGRGQTMGYIYFTGTYDEYGDFRTERENTRSGEYTDLTLHRRPRSEDPFTSLWLTTNSSEPEPVSIMWEAKMFYGEGAIHTPDITDD